MINPSVYSLTHENWKELLLSNGVSGHVLPYWLDGLYKNSHLWKRHISIELMNLFKSQFEFDLPVISSFQESSDGTIKFLIKFKDNLEVETVLIPFHKRFTVCLSTQVGCGMNCSFCYTGTQGLKRNLTSGEIVAQYLVANQWLISKNKFALKPSIVFMGQGEPLHNWSEVLQAVKVLNDRNTVGIGTRQMTLSTVGFLPGIKKLNQFPKINVALSLHSPFEDERSELIPINDRYSLAEIMHELDLLPLLNNQFITYEYLMIKNFNMSDRHVEGLFQLLSQRKAIINLIPFNSFPGSKWERPLQIEIDSFRAKLVEKNYVSCSGRQKVLTSWPPADN